MNNVPLSTPQIIEKAASFSLAGIAFWFLSAKEYMLLVIVMGFAHFFIAYRYQFKAGKIGTSYIIAHTVFLSLVLMLADRLSTHSLLAFASIYFIFHFWIDERFLLRENPSPFAFLECLPFFLCFSAPVIHSFYGVDLRWSMAGVSVLAMISTYFILFANGTRPKSKNWYFFGLNVLGILICLLKVNIPVEKLVGFFILAHYSNWYIYSFFKLKNSTAQLRSYALNVIGFNTLSVSLYSLYKLFPDSFSFLQLLFSQNFFFAWTTTHILFTTRPADLGFFYRRSIPA